MQVPRSFQPALRAAALVSQMAFQAVIGAVIGAWLDGWWGISPVLVLTLGLAGFVSGLLVTWRAFLAAQADGPDNDDPGDSGT